MNLNYIQNKGSLSFTGSETYTKQEMWKSSTKLCGMGRGKREEGGKKAPQACRKRSFWSLGAIPFYKTQSLGKRQQLWLIQWATAAALCVRRASAVLGTEAPTGARKPEHTKFHHPHPGTTRHKPLDFSRLGSFSPSELIFELIFPFV